MILMEITLQILLGILSLICLLGGANLLIKGSKYFLPESIPPQPTLDNLFRFLSGIYLGLAFLLAWVAFHVHITNDLIYFIGIVVCFSGLGRLYSRIKIGPAGKYLYYVMIFEIMLGLSLILLEYSR